MDIVTWVEVDAKKLDDLQQKYLLTEDEKERIKNIIRDIVSLRHDIQKRIHKD